MGTPSLNKISGEILIRQFSPSDLDRIIELENISFQADSFSEATFKDYYHKCPDLFVVAEMSGVIVGYMITCVVSEKALVVSVAVDPGCRRKGIGSALAKSTFNRLSASGVRTVELRVRTTNTEGRRFWENLKFLPVTAIPHFYSDGAEALHMERVLGGF